MCLKEHYKFEIKSEDAGSRLDILLHILLPQYSRTFIQRLITQSKVTINALPVKASHKVNEGEFVEISIPVPEPLKIVPREIPLDIIFEDDFLLVLNKPAGMVVHPGANIQDNTLVHALLYHCQNLSGIGGKLRPGIVHRLDKNTSGLLVIAKEDFVHRELSNQFSEKSIKREYIALVWHRVADDKGEIVTFLNRSKHNRQLFSVSSSGKLAITTYEVEKRFKFLTLLRIRLKTGRTHQIRTHLNYIHHPVFGDPQYFGRQKQLGQLRTNKEKDTAIRLLKTISRQMLHACQLGFKHPITKEFLNFTVKHPDDFKWMLDELSVEEKHL
jgi:23S rRNA pseudouridine1911/1915/1917 synthase